MKLQERLQEVRKQKKMTLLQVKERTELSVSYLSDLERGRTSNPSLETLERIAQCYQMSLADLLSGVDEWGEQTPAGLAPGLGSLLQKKVINEEWAQLLNRIELRGKRPQTEDEWRHLYLYLDLLLGRSAQPGRRRRPQGGHGTGSRSRA